MKTMRVPIVTAINAGRGIPDDLGDWEITGFRDVRLIETTDQAARFIAVPVEGDSLINMHICDGDILICRITRDYVDDKIGLWQTPSGRTAKYAYYDFDNYVVLHNNDGWTQRWEAGELRLLGMVERVERDDV